MHSKKFQLAAATAIMATALFLMHHRYASLLRTERYLSLYMPHRSNVSLFVEVAYLLAKVCINFYTIERKLLKYRVG